MTVCGPPPPPSTCFFFGLLRPHATLTSCPSTLTPTLLLSAANSAASRLTKLTKATFDVETRTTDLILLAGTETEVKKCRIESSVAVAGREVRKREVYGGERVKFSPQGKGKYEQGRKNARSPGRQAVQVQTRLHVWRESSEQPGRKYRGLQGTSRSARSGSK